MVKESNQTWYLIKSLTKTLNFISLKSNKLNQGAKNHGVIMPDANKENSLNQLVGAAFGAAGQRCMALTTAVFVGESKHWIPDLIEKVKKLKVNAGHEPGTDIGPGNLFSLIFNFNSNFCYIFFFQKIKKVISKDSKERIHSIIEQSAKEGAKILLDGRGCVVENYRNGNFVGPTIFGDVNVSQSRSQSIKINFKLN